MKIETLAERRQLRLKVQGIAAALLPYESDGKVAVEAFQRHLAATHDAGLMNAVNMDTGYVNHLSEPEKHDVLPPLHNSGAGRSSAIPLYPPGMPRS